MKTVTFFENQQELSELTGLSALDLWNSDFDIDDMDFGFVTDTEWNQDFWWGQGTPYYEFWILKNMENHCVGYTHTEYRGKHYYILHHS